MKKILLSMLILVIVCSLSMIYATLNTEMQITGEGIVRVDEDIRITDLKYTESNYGAYETYNNKYNKNSTSIFVTMPTKSSITYEVEVTNKTSEDYVLINLEENNSNKQITTNIDTKKYDIYTGIKNITITLTNNTEVEQKSELIVKYEFIKDVEPIIKITNLDDKYLSGANREITYTTEVGRIGAKNVTCNSSNSPITNLKELKVGSHNVTCTLISNTGKTASDSRNVEITNTRYSESVLNSADPVLKDKLIPVNIADNGTVTRANEVKEWYNYTNKRWANAVILTGSQNPNVGDTIPESNIESYFVWIPRYSYQIFDIGSYNILTSINSAPKSIARTINIRFGANESSFTQSVGSYYTHPAFTNFGVSGIWVGKFEVGNKSGVIVKPNVECWRGQTVGTFWNTLYAYNRNLNSHMMKNTEWGAVAYLSHSKYGIGKEIRINNNSAHLTGYAATSSVDETSYPGTYGTSASQTQPYNTSTGYLASTTGNITGIYDMSGGAHEYMAAYIDTYGVKTRDGVASGLTQTDLAKTKYFDLYSVNSVNTNYSFRTIGDATGEIGPFYSYADKDGIPRPHNAWYGDYSYFIQPTHPWFHRGGGYYDGVLAGQFDFARDTGNGEAHISTRLVLAF